MSSSQSQFEPHLSRPGEAEFFVKGRASFRGAEPYVRAADISQVRDGALRKGFADTFSPMGRNREDRPDVTAKTFVSSDHVRVRRSQ